MSPEASRFHTTSELSRGNSCGPSRPDCPTGLPGPDLGAGRDTKGIGTQRSALHRNPVLFDRGMSTERAGKGDTKRETKVAFCRMLLVNKYCGISQ